MASVSYILFLVFSFLLLPFLCLAQEQKRFNPSCPRFRCSFIGDIGFPFSNRSHPGCGLLVVDGCSEPVPKIQLGKDRTWFNIFDITQNNMVRLYEQDFERQLMKCSHKSLKKLTLPISPFLSFNIPYNQSAFQCPLHYKFPGNFSSICNDSQHSYIFYNNPIDHFPSSPPHCSPINYRLNKTQTSVEYSHLLTGFFTLDVKVTDECYDCFFAGGQCQTDSNGKFMCSVTEKRDFTSYGKRQITNYGKVLQ
ncbi:LEAF RUST 10 DISEASE-RESISTANCE LOCUS RECEPTOR-LIKE PROTEIN KINASE-like 1.1 [Mangifera indica]|uniref:LEAF RUST 10 DISEASE-RESISTANCE LOCUS RECEPTOR-LIKE PROTEIN KINASE-like 1.1 n=1 Tax=Mangifera indica TaxID=29780 RepID=UPI001CFA4A6E|nr:LEAF RUST 10 DISEASE-RESISTANCE LOCUS RECEPTOR-LIKE PROTEIN KINASE-like 1.1 [Mangifera indica]